MLSKYTSRTELLRRLDEEYRECERSIRRNEMQAAEVQRQRAASKGDDRQWYWEGVLMRVRRGERLDDARMNEAVKRDGPYTVVTINGQTYPARDLDVWYA